MKVAFCHPDLGLGGAERLVVDAALEIQSHQHFVTLYTTHHDPSRCFAETIDGRLPPVQVHGDWLPRSIFGFGHALCAYVRCVFLAIVMCWECQWRRVRFDVVVVDQVSAVLPVLWLLMPHAKRLFYCHFPDLLLAKRNGWAKRLYRGPIDWVEEVSIGFADQVLVNSRFTQGVFARTFRRLHSLGVTPEILHPAVQIPAQRELDGAYRSWQNELDERLVEFLARPGTKTFLSINRFERKKGLQLAIEALHELLARPPGVATPQLLMAGGFDCRLAENREYYEELEACVRSLGVADKVYFVRSFVDRQKQLFLAACCAVVYTPQNEHFGIVPLEGMAARRPVIACDSGGPTESIIDGQTGVLCHASPGAFAAAMAKVLEEDYVRMGLAARTHVMREFSREVFGDKLNQLVENMVDDNNYDYVH